MKLLWLVNITLPAPCVALQIPPPNTGGWLSGQLAQMDKRALDITVLSFSYDVTAQQRVTLDGVQYIVLPACDEAAEYTLFRDLLAELAPDLVHIHGTELSHSYSMLRAIEAIGADAADIGADASNIGADAPDIAADCKSATAQPTVSTAIPTVISMQGLVYVCAQHYFANLPVRFHKASFLKRLLRLLTRSQSSCEFVAEAQQWFTILGEREKKVLAEGTHFIGRTAWDEHHLKAINPAAQYHKCNEILRSEFYGAPQWNYADCTPHSIFISQGNYPLKGFHILLEAVALLKAKYPDIQVSVTGKAPLQGLSGAKEKTFAPLLQEYPAYLAKLTKKHGLSQHIRYLGNLSAAEMQAQYRAANVFVLASSMENSPNSLAEAMMLGVPCVASDVGGVPDMMTHETEGLRYPFGDVAALAACIKTVFTAKDAAANYGTQAAAHAAKTHDPALNTAALMDIYQQVLAQDAQA